MTLPSAPTLVTYPGCAVSATADVVHLAKRDDGTLAVVLNTTPVHPIDAGWPDQGPDRATLLHQGEVLPVIDAVVAATQGRELFIGADIPVSKGTDGWTFVVAHIVESGAALTEGDRVEVQVDTEYRSAVCAGHTGCHLASLALNRALAQRWKKEVRADALGAADFDGLAIDVSSIGEHGSVDTYRLGKSLRRKGFIMDGLAEDLAAVQESVNTTLAQWISTDAEVRIDCEGPTLTDRRYWVCVLPEQTVRIPCGGTHLNSLAELARLRVELSTEDVAGTTVLRMVTTAR